MEENSQYDNYSAGVSHLKTTNFNNTYEDLNGCLQNKVLSPCKTECHQTISFRNILFSSSLCSKTIEYIVHKKNCGWCLYTYKIVKIKNNKFQHIFL